MRDEVSVLDSKLLEILKDEVETLLSKFDNASEAPDLLELYAELNQTEIPKAEEINFTVDGVMDTLSFAPSLNGSFAKKFHTQMLKSLRSKVSPEVKSKKKLMSKSPNSTLDTALNS